jgi:hypothetical protein
MHIPKYIHKYIHMTCKGVQKDDIKAQKAAAKEEKTKKELDDRFRSIEAKLEQIDEIIKEQELYKKKGQGDRNSKFDWIFGRGGS